MAIPTLGTYAYFDLLATAAPMVQKTAYVLAKLSQFGVLLIAIWYRHNHTTDASHFEPKTQLLYPYRYAIGVASGVFIGIAIVGLYQWLLLPFGFMNQVKPIAQAKLQSLGASSPIVLVAIAIFYSALHSGFEELYWRGFVYRGLNEYVGLAAATCLSSLAFMSHHVIVLGKFFGYGSLLTYLLSLGVAVGGAIWAFSYARFGSLIPGWISHAIVDAAIFGVGYLLLFC